MHLLHHRKQVQRWFLYFIFIVGSSAVTVDLDSPCDSSRKNCHGIGSDSLPPVSNKVVETATISLKSSSATQRSSNSNNVYMEKKDRATSWPPVFPSTTSGSSDLDDFGENLKLSAIVLAAIALVLGIIRVCLMFCKTSSNNRPTSTATLQRRRRVAAQPPFKPDLPPAYSVAIRDQRTDEAKPPSYDDLPPEQRQVFTVPIHDELPSIHL